MVIGIGKQVICIVPKARKENHEHICFSSSVNTLLYDAGWYAIKTEDS